MLVKCAHEVLESQGWELIKIVGNCQALNGTTMDMSYREYKKDNAVRQVSTANGEMNPPTTNAQERR